MSKPENQEELSKYIDSICKAIRETIQEHGKDAIKDAVIVDEMDLLDHTPEIGGIKYLYCPTVTSPTLGNVDYKVARYFEDVYEGYTV